MVAFRGGFVEVLPPQAVAYVKVQQSACLTKNSDFTIFFSAGFL